VHPLLIKYNKIRNCRIYRYLYNLIDLNQSLWNMWTCITVNCKNKILLDRSEFLFTCIAYNTWIRFSRVVKEKFFLHIWRRNIICVFNRCCTNHRILQLKFSSRGHCGGDRMGAWIYNYLCNQCWSPLTLWVRIPLMARYTWYNIMW